MTTCLLSIEGGGLMKNPFEKKKLKKVANKKRWNISVFDFFLITINKLT
jgi:hypothetical protein